MQAAKVKGRNARAKFTMNKLRLDAKAAFSPSNFAASAKLERQANAVEAQMQATPRASFRLKMAGTVIRGVQVCSAS